MHFPQPKELSDEGIEAEVIDLRTLKPLDEEGLLESVRRTGRLMVVEESCRTGGWGAQVVDTASNKHSQRSRRLRCA